MPMRVYAERESVDALRTAMQARPIIRAEAPLGTVPNDATKDVTGNHREHTVNDERPRSGAVHGDHSQIIAPENVPHDA
jgi:hypothetical protein